MHLLTLTLSIAALALTACDAGTSASTLKSKADAAPAALHTEDGSWLEFESGMRVVLEGERVALYSEQGGAEMEAGEALALAQAVVYAGMDAAQRTKTGTKDPWPPDWCRTSDDDEDDPKDEGEEPLIAERDSTSGCPLRLILNSDDQAQLLKEAGAELFEISGDGAQYALGYWHSDAEQYGENRLAFANGVVVERHEDRVVVRLPKAEIVLSAGEALALGYAAAYAGSDAAALIGKMPYPWPPDVCDRPIGTEERGWGGCPVPFMPGPELWDAVVPETGIPIAAGDPKADLVYTFGFWHRAQIW